MEHYEIMVKIVTSFNGVTVITRLGNPSYPLPKNFGEEILDVMGKLSTCFLEDEYIEMCKTLITGFKENLSSAIKSKEKRIAELSNE